MESGGPREDGFSGQRLTVLPPSVVHEAARLPIARDLLVTHAGRFDRVQCHQVDRPHGRPEYVFLFCLSGEGRVRLGDTSHRLSCGEGAILPPRQAHHYAADPVVPWTIFWFHFIGRRARDYVRLLGTDEGQPRFGVEKVETVAEAFEECYRYTGGDWTHAKLIAMTTSFARLMGLCGSLRRVHCDRRMESEQRVARALRFMHENLGRPVELAELAGHVALSVSRFTALFSERMNCAPIDFYIRLKMQRASELLLTTQLPAGEIGRMLGYDDPFYFSRLFKNKIGLPPRDYRRRAARERGKSPG